jgi:4-amino-4-deoxy-L-arabinose transferase-like glycosyltransferase
VLDVADLAEMELLALEAAAARRTQPFPVPEYDGPSTGELEAVPGRRPAWSRLGRNWPLLAVLAVQAVLSLRLVWSNTAFQDEALYLWAGHLELAHWLHGTPVPAFQTYFSGAPVVYPPLGAIADAFGGLAAARLLSLAFMLGATGLLYGTGARVAGRKAGACSALAFSLLGPVQFLSAFATYDAMALFLLALASWLAVRASGPLPELYLIAGGLVLALADAAKYATALWNPVVFVLAGLAAANGGKLRRSLRGARVAAYTAAPAAVALFRYGGPSYVQGVLFTTVARQVGSATASAGLVLRDSANWLWFLLILAAIGTALAFASDGRRVFAGRGRFRAVLVTCTAAALLAPLHQAQIHTTVSLHKHVAFGAWFGAIAAGYALARAADAAREKGWRIAAAAAVVMSFSGVPQATQLFTNGWPDMRSAEAVLARSVAATGCPCLVTADSVTYYYLLRVVYPGNLGEFTGPYYFYYWDAAGRRELSGTAAYLQAIRDHYFKIIEMDPGEPLAPAAAILKLMAGTPGYQQVAVISVFDPEHDNAHGVVRIWHYSPDLAVKAVRSGAHG